MRHFMACLVVMLAACSAESDPVPGTYLVTSKLVGDLCEGSTSTTDDVTQLWIIAKETTGYSLTLQDDQNSSQMVATASDGRNFKGGADADLFGCIYHVSWEMDVTYGDNKITGDSTSSLAADCTSETCSERRTFEGPKQ